MLCTCITNTKNQKLEFKTSKPCFAGHFCNSQYLVIFSILRQISGKKEYISKPFYTVLSIVDVMEDQ